MLPLGDATQRAALALATRRRDQPPRREKGRFVVCGTKRASRSVPSRWRPLSYDEWGAACFDHPSSAAFICHGIGFTSIPLGNLTFHRAHLARTVTRVLDAQRPELRRMLAARGEPPERIQTVAVDIDRAVQGGGRCAGVDWTGPKASEEGVLASRCAQAQPRRSAERPQ